ncbi:MAG: SUMF1/EgtB/PvdO family nonheme iron enzyme [Planctomycetota bacterium]
MAKRKGAGSDAKVFISYRKADCDHVADRLREALARTFGGEAVFLDHRSIGAGEDWRDALTQSVQECAVVLVLIGPEWLTAQNEYGRRRLDDPEDWVRAEVEAALGAETAVPVLVNEARPLPKAAIHDLPIAALADLQATRLRLADWDHDVATLVALLHGKGLTSVEPPPDGAAPAARPTPLAADASELEKYRATMEEAHGTLALAGFETKVRVPVRLEDLYVPLAAQLMLGGTECTFSDAAAAESARKDLRQREDVALTQAFSCAAARGHRGIVVLGDPGSGKTTQLKRMLLGVLREGPELLGLPEGVVPLFLPLRLLQPEDLQASVAALLARTFPPTARFATDLAERLVRGPGRRLYLFDGLDEVPASRRPDVGQWIQDALVHDPDGYFAVTSRYAGYDEAAREALGVRFLELHLRPLDEDQRDAFVRNWYGVIESYFDPQHGAATGAAKADELIGRLRDRKFRAQRVSSLTANPLLLTNVCLVHRDRGSYLPQGRERLYRECLNVLLELWRDSKQLGIALTAERAREALQPVALYLHDEEGRTRAPAAELAPVLAETLRQVGWTRSAEAFLEVVRDESGLLTGWSHAELGFLHLGFQEYLAACEIHRQVTEAGVEGGEAPPWLDVLAERFGQNWWREVTLLLLALEGTSLFRPLFVRVVEREAFVEHEDLVQECLEEAKRVDPAPFAALLDRDAGDDVGLAERQLVAARALQRVAPDELEKRQRVLAKSASRAVRERFGGSTVSKRGGTHEKTGIEMVDIPAGTFVMGSPKSEKDRFDVEGPQREVAVARFALARTAVTNAQYAVFLEATGHRVPAYWDKRQFNRSEQPVVGVSWEDARAFCRWAGLSLPSEAQWEYACRAGTTTRFWSGGSIKDLKRVGWYDGNAKGKLHPVGEKPANDWGLLDMHGNVFEWCQDEWHRDYTGAPCDGSAWEEDGSGARVFRGGAWRYDARVCRSAFRSWWRPDYRIVLLGFRPASSRD